MNLGREHRSQLREQRKKGANNGSMSYRIKCGAGVPLRVRVWMLVSSRSALSGLCRATRMEISYSGLLGSLRSRMRPNAVTWTHSRVSREKNTRAKNAPTLCSLRLPSFGSGSKNLTTSVRCLRIWVAFMVVVVKRGASVSTAWWSGVVLDSSGWVRGLGCQTTKRFRLSGLETMKWHGPSGFSRTSERHTEQHPLLMPSLKEVCPLKGGGFCSALLHLGLIRAPLQTANGLNCGFVSIETRSVATMPVLACRLKQGLLRCVLEMSMLSQKSGRRADSGARGIFFFFLFFVGFCSG